MIFTPLPIAGAFRVDLERREDARGFFARFYCAEEFGAQGLCTDWAQMNTSLSRRAGTLRGLHFQRPPAAEAKLVRCLRGAIHDVLVDLRTGSPTYGHWHAERLDDDNRAMLYIPEGCAHGFQTLTPDTELFYMHSAPYSPAQEGGLHHADPTLAIDWPLPITDLSERDARFPMLNDLEPFLP